MPSIDFANVPAETEDSQKRLYSTSDQVMIEVLLMLHHNPDQVVMDELTGQIVYHFRKEDVAVHVNAVQTNHADELMVTVQDWWRAKYTWQTNLRHFGASRRGRDR